MQKEEYIVQSCYLWVQKQLEYLWYKTEHLSEKLLYTVEEMYVMEKKTHRRRLQETQFNEKREKWTNCIMQEEDYNGDSK